jgi:putative Holliday junction resolvase
MRPGVRLGVDVGKVRIGVARSDPHGMLATPVSTVARGVGDLAELLRISTELEAVEIIVGLPLALSGAHTASTNDASDFAATLASASSAPVRLVDARLSTVSAQQALRSSGRNSRNSRSVIDQVAAVIILQHALDFERGAGNPPGVLVHSEEGSNRGE